MPEPLPRPRPPKDSRRPFLLSLVFTVVAVLLATVHNFGGSYDPTLAVLTATLVAVIWYTYFSYLAVHKQLPTRLSTDFQAESHNLLHLHPVLSNPNHGYIRVRVYLDLWFDGRPFPTDGFYSGKETLVLAPGDGFSGNIEIDEATLGNPDTLLVRLRAEWEDDAGNSGTTPWKHWSVDTATTEAAAIVGESEIGRLFDNLPAVVA